MKNYLKMLFILFFLVLLLASSSSVNAEKKILNDAEKTEIAVIAANIIVEAGFDGALGVSDVGAYFSPTVMPTEDYNKNVILLAKSFVEFGSALKKSGLVDDDYEIGLMYGNKRIATTIKRCCELIKKKEVTEEELLHIFDRVRFVQKKGFEI